jgi:predicted hotdog family 3-hydroxylacyl-ACP dehydratase
MVQKIASKCAPPTMAAPQLPHLARQAMIQQLVKLLDEHTKSVDCINEKWQELITRLDGRSPATLLEELAPVVGAALIDILGIARVFPYDKDLPRTYARLERSP